MRAHGNAWVSAAVRAEYASVRAAIVLAMRLRFVPLNFTTDNGRTDVGNSYVLPADAAITASHLVIAALTTSVYFASTGSPEEFSSTTNAWSKISPSSPSAAACANIASV